MENNIKYTKEEYNDEPVTYCSHCNSLHIKILDSTNIDYCVECGNTDTETSHIEEWLKKDKELKNKEISSLDLDKIVNDIIKK